MSKPLTTQEFIDRCSKIHNNRYDYSLVNYISAFHLVTIICPIHGEFEQEARNHLYSKSGCNKRTFKH